MLYYRMTTIGVMIIIMIVIITIELILVWLPQDRVRKGQSISPFEQIIFYTLTLCL